MPPIDTIDIMKRSPDIATTTNSPVKIKLLVIGNSSVGKSHLLLRFLGEEWLPRATVNFDIRPHNMKVNGRKVKLSIWDTAGQERFRTLTSGYYHGAQGIILVYDVTDRKTFDALPGWFSEIDARTSAIVPKILVGNKVDMEDLREVPTAEGSAFASRHGFLFTEASAQTGIGVHMVFEEVVARILKIPELWAPIPRGEDSISGTVALSRRASGADDGGKSSCAC